jgi:hypothetical protein
VVTNRRQLSFYSDADTDAYLSLIDSGMKTKVINRALREFMQREAVVDMANGKHPANFWDLPTNQKNELLKHLSDTGEGKADDDLWKIVCETTPQDFYQYAAKYLSLHQLKFGRPYQFLASPQPQPVKLRKHFHERESEEKNALKRTTVTLWLRVENNSKFVRGKKRAREDIEYMALNGYDMKKLGACEYELTFTYKDDADLDKQIHDLLIECEHFADLRNCFTESDVRENGTDRSW